MRFYIYEYWLNDIVSYVGKGTNNTDNLRVFYHLSRKSNSGYWANKLRKAVREGAKVVIKIVHVTKDEQDAFAKEVELILKYGRKDLGAGTLYNQTNGGDGTSGYKPSAETTAKIVAKTTGSKRSPETRARMAEARRQWHANRDPVLFELTKSKISEKHMGKVLSDETRAKMRAKVVSNETRAKMSASRIARNKQKDKQ